MADGDEIELKRARSRLEGLIGEAIMLIPFCRLCALYLQFLLCDTC